MPQCLYLTAYLTPYMELSLIHISTKVPVVNLTVGTIFMRFHGHFIFYEISKEGEN